MVVHPILASLPVSIIFRQAQPAAGADRVVKTAAKAVVPAAKSLSECLEPVSPGGSAANR